MEDVSVAPKLLSFQLLEEITNGFSEDRKVGRGSYGNVYKGEHTNGKMIAVKVLHYIPGLNDEQFEKEYHNLASLQHKNIVRLLGYCHETRREFVPYNGEMVFAEMTQRALCFEYMQNGSLDSCLTDESTGHDWRTRYAIIKGICQGLKYLHEELNPPMYHLDLKPANVLLDENMVPKIADFGLSRLLGGEQTQMTKSAIGTHGYVPPEYIDSAIVSVKFDIYSLGVVIIKIMTGPKGYFRSAEMSPQQFVELVHGNWKSKLRTTLVHGLSEPYSEQVKICVEIALSCVDADRHKRPTIGEIINMLNETETLVKLAGTSANDIGSTMYKVMDFERKFAIKNVDFQRKQAKRQYAGSGFEQINWLKLSVSVCSLCSIYWPPSKSQNLLPYFCVVFSYIDQFYASSVGLLMEVNNKESNNMEDVSVAPKLLSFQLLEEITNGFSEDRKVGRGSYGNVYKGEHTNGKMIAVKVLHYIPGLDDEQFEKEYHNLASLQHRNIVQLLGYCHETRREFVPYNGKMVFAEMTQRALCFEYMQNGSLDGCLTDESTGHDWRTRYAIIKGICHGLKYLHEELSPPMYHLDLKPGNVLLDEHMVPKIADFGLSRLFGGEQTQMTKSAIGTHGYVPPEYIDAAIVSVKFDIYSLGVVIIKIMTGPKGYFRSAEMSLQQFVELVHGNWKSKLRATLAHGLSEPYSEQVKICVEIALSCVDVDRHKRPSIGEIIHKLNKTETAVNDIESTMYNDDEEPIIAPPYSGP